MLAPSGWLSRVSTRSCLVTRSTFGSSAFLSVLAAATRSAFDSTDRVGFLALAAGDVTLRRDAVFDWALPFLGAALFVFRDFMERVDIVWAPLIRGAGIGARTTQSPAHREASPECFTGWPCPPAGTHSNASFAAEVKSIFWRVALEASQSRGLVSRLTGAPARLLNGAQRDCVYARAVDVTQRR